MAVPSLSILGAGRLGKTLGRLWHDKHIFHLRQIYCRTLTSARDAVGFIGAGAASDNLQTLLPADLWLIATPDAAIADTASALVQSGALQPGAIVFHCSGALSSEVLAARLPQFTNSASLHPIHSFADPTQSLTDFHGSYCAAEGNQQALNQLKPAFEAIGANVFELDPSAKTLYHAGSVIACNYLVSLLEASLNCFEQAGIERKLAMQFLRPITHSTLANTLREGPVKALTGPIARGDVATVEKQLQALQQNDDLLQRIYRTLGEFTLDIARRQQATIEKQGNLKQGVDKHSLDLLQTLFSGNPNEP